MKTAGFRVIIWALMAAIFTPALAAQDRKGAKLPILQQAGVIPVQWEGNSDGVSGVMAKGRIAKAFNTAVASSSRFRLIDSDLIANQWSTASGRQELDKQYELHAFLGLNVAVKEDTVQLVFRVMGPALENYLVESDVVTRNWLNAATQRQIDEKLTNLVYRTLNRLPIDVTITSVQGKFITFSGGKAQRIEVGDEVTLIRAGVTSKHPANGSWLEFRTQTLGTAKIVESNPNTSVAQLTRLVSENAAEVGDGARIPAIVARNKFKPQERGAQIVDNNQGNIVIPAQTSGSQPKKTNEQKPNAENPTDASEPVNFSELLSGKFSHYVVEAGPRLWQASGRGSAKAKLPIWLINHIGATGYRSIGEHMQADVGLALDFGPTANGSFFGFGLHGRAYYSAPLQTDIGARNAYWRAGGIGQLVSIGIDDETYGGRDTLALGGFAGVGGSGQIVGKDVDWHSDFYLVPLSLGSVGVRGKKVSIKSSLGWLLVAGATLPHSEKDFEWGGEFRYGSQNFSLTGNRELVENELALLATGRYKF